MDSFSGDEFKRKLSEVLFAKLDSHSHKALKKWAVFKIPGVCPQVFPHLRTQSPRKRLLRRLIMIVQKFCFICSVKTRNNIIMAQFKNILVSYMNDDERK